MNHIDLTLIVNKEFAVFVYLRKIALVLSNIDKIRRGCFALKLWTKKGGFKLTHYPTAIEFTVRNEIRENPARRSAFFIT
jgi:hypothetical protein